MWVLFSFALPQGHLCAPSCVLLHPATGIPLSYVWQVQVPCTKTQFQRFRVAHWAVQKYVFIPISYFNPPYISKCSSSFTFRIPEGVGTTDTPFSENTG